MYVFVFKWLEIWLFKLFLVFRGSEVKIIVMRLMWYWFFLSLVFRILLVFNIIIK